MTYREKAMVEHPDYISGRYIGGVKGCPHDGPYYYTPFAWFRCRATDEGCRECWDREINKSETEKVFHIEGCIGVPESLTDDEMLYAFLEMMESKNWTFGGEVTPYSKEEI